MRKVIDNNRLQSSELREYLNASNKSLAVLTDYAAMDAYKGDTLKSIYPSMAIVSEFPRQVLILKSTLKVVGLLGREKGLQRRLIDKGQTSTFSKYCADLSAARSGDKALEKSLLRKGKEASQHLEKVMADAVRFPETMDYYVRDFTRQELDVIRKGASFTNELACKIIKQAMTVAALMGDTHPQSRGLPPLDELPNTFLFRFALSGMVCLIHRIESGGFGKRKPVNLRNDVVDLSFSAYATYFDGLMTNDKKLVSIYEVTAALLNFFKRSLRA